MYVLPAPGAEGPPIGRDREISRLKSVVRSLAAGKGAVVEITGEPGIGKTSLLGVLTAEAAALGIDVARARSLRGNDIPYQVFSDAWVNLRSRGSSDAHFPAAHFPAEMSASDDPSQLHLFRESQAIRRLFAQWAESGGGVLALDDLHLCDRRSADLVAQLVRTPVPGPFLLAVAHRPRQTPLVLLEALAHGARTGTVARIEPGPLDVAATATLLGRWETDLPKSPANQAADLETYAKQLHNASGGNPSYLRILVAGNWRPEGWPDYLEADRNRLLRRAAAPAAELDALGPHATLVAGTAAALGDPFRPDDVAAACRLEVSQAIEAIAELVRAGIVNPLSSGRFSFRHPVLRHIAHERAEASVRLTAHQHALDLMIAHGASAAAQARHAEHCLGTDSAAAAGVLAEGALEILAEAPAAAARWLRLALKAQPDGVKPAGDRATLMLACCRALTYAGKLQEARDLTHELLSDPARLTVDQRMQAHGIRAAIEVQLGRFDEAATLARTAIEELPRPLPDVLPEGTAELIFNYGLVHMLRGTYADVRDLLQELVNTDANSTAMTWMATRLLVAFGDCYLGDALTAGPVITEHARLIDGMSDAQAARSPELLVMLGCAELTLDRFADASRHLQRMLTLAKSGGPQHNVPYSLLGISFAEQQAGRLDLAERWALQAERVARSTGSWDALGVAIARRAGVLVWSRRRSDSPEIIALIEEGIRAISPRGWWAGFAIGQLAAIQLMSGDAQGCIQTMMESGGGENLPLIPPSFHPVLLSMLSGAALRCGDLDAARRWARGADAAAERSGLPIDRAHAHRAAALLHAVEGRPDTAADLFEQAANGFRRAGVPLEYAATLHLGARSIEAARGPSAAAGWLDRAVALADKWGAQRLLESAERARRGLAERAAGERQTTGPGDDPLATLTAREREIASLAGAGWRTREIADQLYLSPRTVDAHLTRIYRKLDISSRAALTNLLLRAGEGKQR